MSVLKQEAVKIIEEMQEDVMIQVVAYLKNISVSHTDTTESMKGLQILQSFAGTLPSDFDYKRELEEARDEKYKHFN